MIATSFATRPDRTGDGGCVIDNNFSSENKMLTTAVSYSYNRQSIVQSDSLYYAE